MKKILSLLVGALMCTTVLAQHGPMAFAGPSKFGVEAMNAWQENESDTIYMQLNGTTDADIIMPAMTYNAMGLTIPSFTIKGATYTYDYTTGSVVFGEQTYTDTLQVNGVEKIVNGTLKSASYSHSSKALSLTTVLTYGSMPMPVTYIIENAAYQSPTTAIDEVRGKAKSQQVYDLSGRRVAPEAGQIYIINGKKTFYSK